MEKNSIKSEPRVRFRLDSIKIFMKNIQDQFLELEEFSRDFGLARLIIAVQSSRFGT